ncbi:MAG: VCBS repeat-containing protein, partial [Deltaproteobacteria bacterium]|nr:VCBS repeat-containing protein [Deltaproteobacteria bacterium]
MAMKKQCYRRWHWIFWIALAAATWWPLAACPGCDKPQPEPGTGGAGAPCNSADDCADGLGCHGGHCAECGVGAPCANGQVCVDYLCVPDCPADDRCGQGGSCCPGNAECIDGVCRPYCDGVRCGPRSELCCTAGQVCEEQRCVRDCAGNARCGQDLSICCGAGQICYGASCTTPGQPCVLQSDCPPDQACEVDLGVCIDRTAIGDCEYHPPPGVFNPEIECRWSPGAGDPTPARVDVVMAPAVLNLTDDNGDGVTDTFDVPDVVFISYDFDGQGCCNVQGTLHVVSGRCQADGSMRTHFSSADPPLDNSGGVALGDLDGDGVAEIVAIMNVDHPQGTVAFKRSSDDGSSWRELWRNETYPTWAVHTRGGAQPALAELDGDGHPDVIVGNLALDGLTGALLWDGVVTSGGSGGIGNNAFLGPVSTAANLDRQGRAEVIAGNTLYNSDGTVRWSYPYTTSNSTCGGSLPCDGFTAVADFDGDAEGEIVIVRLGEVFVLQHTGELLFSTQIPLDDCLNDLGEPLNEAGPPTVADFDGDGRAEIGTAAADYYAVVDPDCVGTPLPAGCSAQGVLWTVANRDCSSRVTASSVFDFDGDGNAEVIYGDETTFRILDGRSGAALYTDSSHRSHTRLEEAVIADVDNDGNAEVVIAENRSGGGTPGVVIWGDAADNWVYTRRVWNQHSYHVTNVGETGVVPSDEPANWDSPGLNNFRQNVQGEGLFWAPDLVVINLVASCEIDQTVFIAFDVMNQGSRMVGDGVAVTVYVMGTAQTT